MWVCRMLDYDVRRRLVGVRLVGLVLRGQKAFPGPVTGVHYLLCRSARSHPVCIRVSAPL